MSGPGPMTGDGPWHVADRLRVIVVSAEAEAAGAAADRAAAAAVAAGIPIEQHRSVASSGLRDVWPRPGEDVVDILLVDAATTIEAGSLAELRRVADTDPMLLGTMPRIIAAADDAARFASFPGVSYAAVPDPRCLYLKGAILSGFCRDYAEPAARDVATWVVSLNRYGFRVAIANHAVAHHPGGEATDQTTRTAPELPHELRRALSDSLSSAPRVAEAVMRGLRPGPDGRRAVAFDLAHVAARHSGTTDLARALVRRAADRWRDCHVHVVATEAVFAFHFGDSGRMVTRVDPADGRCFAALIRIGQPFLWKDVDGALPRAPVLVFFMLDTIGLDCLAHAPDELDALWRFVLAEADGLLFNSAFTERQFARRFVLRPGLPRRASLHSLDVSDYRVPVENPRTGPEPADAGPAGAILVMGNGFPHKHLRETAALIAGAALPEPVVVLGLAPGTVDGVVSLPSGDLAPSRLASLIGSAKLVVYPSVYEGFGFPILQALAQRKPILVRPLPPYAEIAAGLPERANVHLFQSDEELLRMLRHGLRWTEDRGPERARNWDDAADDLRAILDESLAAVSYDRVVRRLDVLRGRMAFMRSRAFMPENGTTAEDLDRLAGVAGRAARSLVLTLGRRLPGSAAILGLADRVLRRPRGS